MTFHLSYFTENDMTDQI